MAEDLWAYCDVCDRTRPVNGADLRDWLATGEVNSYTDLVCSVCYNVIATVSLGPANGSEPQVPPPVLPPRDQPEDAPSEPQDNALRRVYSVNLRR